MTAVQDPVSASISYEAFQALAPAAVSALRALTKAVDDTGLDKALTELLKVRISQINGCSFCTHFHLGLARQVGVDAVKLDLVAVWRDAGVFSPREKVALDWAEHLTRTATDAVPEDAYAQLREVFSEVEVANLTVSIATINAWNRIAGSLRFPPLIKPKG